MSEFILKIDCDDEKGLVFKIANEIFKSGLNIISNNEFVDSTNKKFYFLAKLDSEGIDFSKESLRLRLQNILPNANIYLDEKRTKNIVVFATKETHCLGDILLAEYAKELDINIKMIIANHDLSDLVKRFDKNFKLIKALDDRMEYEQLIKNELDKIDFDYIVLAKYMRILSKDFVDTYKDKIINIHHSFLPAFIGANPYLQAYNRGVKIIGASAHFVTSNLDEGPIIHQDVVRIDHSMNASELRNAGRKIETLVLRCALEKVFDDRVFINNNKTIIF